MKKFFSLVLALVMALSLTTVAWGATTTTVSNTDELQAALDKATDGDTIYLTTGVNYGVVYLGRPNANNVTKMVCNSHPDQTFTDAAAFKAHMNDGNFHHVPYYTTELSNITIVGAEGATVAGFVVTSDAGTNYDYVLGVERYRVSYLKLSNLTFENVAFTGKVDINSSLTESEFDGVTFNGCSFTTGGTAESNGMAIRYYNENNDGNVKNLVVNNCSFYNCRQGVYTANVNGITVTDCTFDTLGHNAVAVQSQGSCDHGDVVITENKFENVADRVIRFNEVGADSDIAINNNVMVNCGDDAGELIKATSVDSTADVDLESNYWDGEDVDSGVIAGVLATDWKPTTYATSVAADGTPSGMVTTAGVPTTHPANCSSKQVSLKDCALVDLTTGDSHDFAKTDKATLYTFDTITSTVNGVKTTEYGATVYYFDGMYGLVVAKDYANAQLELANGKFVYLRGISVAEFTNASGRTSVVVDKFVDKADDTTKCGAATEDYVVVDGDFYAAEGTTLAYYKGEFVLIGDKLDAEPLTPHGFMTGDEDCKWSAKDNKLTSVKCTCDDTFKVVQDIKGLKAGSYYALGDGNYVVLKATSSGKLPSGTTTPSTDKVQSADTFDAGIAMYVGMSVMAAAGSAVVIGKKKD